jgi:hypothetical protein
VVEVQRISGCSFLYCQAAKAILRAAKGLKKQPARTFCLPASIPRVSIKAQEASLEEGLSIAFDMLLQEKRVDLQVIALESLLCLSKKDYCARIILKNQQVLDILLALLQCSRLSRLVREESVTEMEESRYVRMHQDAITVLANCLVALEASGDLCALVQEQSQLQSQSLVMSLVQAVSHCTKRPHDACQAVRCLQMLVSKVPLAKQRLVEAGGFQVVAHAHKDGLSRHETLYEECDKLQQQMGNVF